MLHVESTPKASPKTPRCPRPTTARTPLSRRPTPTGPLQPRRDSARARTRRTSRPGRQSGCNGPVVVTCDSQASARAPTDSHRAPPVTGAGRAAPTRRCRARRSRTRPRPTCRSGGSATSASHTVHRDTSVRPGAVSRRRHRGGAHTDRPRRAADPRSGRRRSRSFLAGCAGAAGSGCAAGCRLDVGPRRTGRLRRSSGLRQDASANFAELDRTTTGAEDDLVAVGEKRSPCQSSSSEPSDPGSGPEIAPVAIRSPALTEAPFEVACASCCGIVQYRVCDFRARPPRRRARSRARGRAPNRGHLRGG